MWYFMAGMEEKYKSVSGINCDFGLATFLGINKQEKVPEILSKVNHLLVDSGAYSFRVSKRNSDFDTYVEQYVEFVKNNTNNPQIVGFFELDIDSLIGYDKVLEYRRRLEAVSDKIIPVWHQNRGISEFIKMCKDYSGKRVSVACVGWHDMYPEQLNLFINTAHKYGCKIHILGMTSKEVLKHSNLGLEDSFDSVSWALTSAYAKVNLNIKDTEMYSLESSFARLNGVTSTQMNIFNYLTHRKLQDYYKYRDQSVIIKDEN